MKQCRVYRKGYRCILISRHKCAHHFANDWGAFVGGTFVCSGLQHEIQHKVRNENREPRLTVDLFIARKLTAQERLWYVK